MSVDPDFYKDVLGSPRHVLAPMVDASELAWRQLSRRYGTHLCYTPMWHAGVFVRDERYRQDALQTCPEDRPLIVQFCANDPDILKRAVELTLQLIDCDAIDINFGCPQVIARRGHFGAFLQDEWDLIQRLIRAVKDNFNIPVTAKFRVFDDLDRTVDYAKMMEDAGAKVLAVHGRTREQKGHMTGLASWKHIKAVKDAVNVPVIANGNIQYFEDVARCIEATGVDGVMSAEGHLTNPALFAGKNPTVWDMSLEYLQLVEKYPCPLSYTRGHLFKMLHHCLQMKMNFDVRQIVAKGSSLVEFHRAVQLLKERLLPYHEGKEQFVPPEELKAFNLKYPPWICQPYVRPSPEEHLKKLEQTREKERQAMLKKRGSDEDESGVLSKRKVKKMEKNPNKRFPHARENCKLCLLCPNPSGQRCDYQLCKKCCRHKCYVEELDCTGHRILVKSKREAARRHKEQQVQSDHSLS